MTTIVLSFLSILKLATIFVFVVAVIWVTKHYRSQRGGAAGFSTEEQTVVEDLARIAEKMDRRLQTLEKIIEADHPGWKERI